MDWKNHILTAEGCQEAAREFLPMAKEEFLVTLANKGLYKRALKDLDSLEQAAAQLGPDGKLQVQLGDVTVTLNNPLGESECTCPSKTICKHVLMAVLTAAELAQGGEEHAENGEENAENEEAYLALRLADVTELRKKAGKRVWDDAMRLLREGGRAVFEEGDMLSALLGLENMTVFFPKQDSIQSAVCKCGAKGLCRHKVAAILSYLEENGLLLEQNERKTASFFSENELALLENAMQFILIVFEKGILNCGDTEHETASQFSLRFDGAGMGNFARLFRALSSDIKSMQTKHVSFKAEETFARLSRLYHLTSLLLKNQQNSEIASSFIESSRSEYFPVLSGSFIGLGAYPWKTQSGYAGVTALVYYEQKKCVCTFSASTADFYEKTEQLSDFNHLSGTYSLHNHWMDGISIKEAASSSFTLKNFQINAQNRISDSKKTSYIQGGAVNAQQLESLALPLAKDYIPENSFDYFGRRRAESLYLVPCARIQDISFDKAKQTLYFVMQCQTGEEIGGMLPYSDVNSTAVRFLEAMGGKSDFKTSFLCFARSGYFQPVSAADQKMVFSFYFNEKGGKK